VGGLGGRLLRRPTWDLAGDRHERATHRLMARGGSYRPGTLPGTEPSVPGPDLMARGGSYRPGISPGTEPSVPRTVSWLRGEWPFELFGSAVPRQVQRWVVERLRRGPLHVPRSRVLPGASYLCQTGGRTLLKENCGSRKKEQASGRARGGCRWRSPDVSDPSLHLSGNGTTNQFEWRLSAKP
jgi:hypothetical protein